MASSNQAYISGFNTPRHISDEMRDFLLNAPCLKEITSSMSQLKQGISSQAIITSLLTLYCYNKDFPDRPSLAYFSFRNITAIRQVLLEKSITVVLTEKESAVLEAFKSGSAPWGISHSDVETALRKVGIDKTTRYTVVADTMDVDLPEELTNEQTPITEKVINGQYLGVDTYMKRNLIQTLTQFVISSVNRGRNRTIDNFNFADLQMITNISLDDQRYQMSDTNKEKYVQHIVPIENKFREVYRSSNRIIRLSSSPSDQVKDAYEAVVNAKVDYDSLLQQMGDVCENLKLRVALDKELQDVKIFRLSNLM